MLTLNAPLPEVLTWVCQIVEQQAQGRVCSIFLLDGERLRYGAAPRLPKTVIQALDGLVIGPRAGSCGTAVFRREPVIVSDISDDPLWESFREVALEANLASCWSMPILSNGNSVLGAFAMYSRMPGRPSSEESELIKSATYMAQMVVEKSQAENALKELQHRHQELYEHAPVMYASLDHESGTILECNHTLLQETGYSKEEIVGRSVLELYSQDFRARAKNIFEELKHAGEMHHQYLQFQGKDGRILEVDFIASVVRDKGGRVLHCKAMWQNITRQINLEEALRDSEDRFQSLVEAIPQQVWTATPDGALDYVNHQVVQYCNLSFEQMIGWGWKEVLHPEDVTECLRRWTRALQTGEPYEIEFRLRRGSDGAYLWHIGRALPLYDQDGRIVKWFGTNTDISAHKEAEETMRQSEERYRALYHDTPSMYFTVAQDGRVLSVNRFGAEQLGFTVEELVGQSVWTVVHEEDQPEVQDQLAQCFKDPTQIRHWEFRKVCKDGRVMWVKEAVHVVQGSEGNPRALIVCEDITDRKRTEEALRESEGRFRSVAQSANDAIISADHEGLIVSWNTGAETMFRYTEQEVEGKPLTLLMPQRYRDSHREGLKRLQDTGKSTMKGRTIELYGLRKDGTEFPLELVISSWDLGEKSYVTGIIRDITDRKRVEEALRGSEQRFRQLAENIREVFWLSDPDKNHVLYVSPGYEEIWGHSCESLYASPRSWIQGIHPEDRDRVLRAALRDQVAGTYDEEFRVVRPDGSLRWVRDRAFPVKDKDGRVWRIAGIAEDITDKKITEEALKEAHVLLEHRVAERTKELREANYQLSAEIWERERTEEDLRLSEERFRDLYESAPLAYLSVAMDGIIWKANAQASELLGYSHEELIGRHVVDLYAPTPDGQEKARKLNEKIIKGREIVGEELEAQRADGSRLWIDLTVRFIRDGQGRPIERRAMLKDITERKQAEEKLRHSEEMVRLLVQSTAEAIYQIDLEGRCTFCNPACVQLLGFHNSSDLIGKNMHQLIHHSYPDGSRYPPEQCNIFLAFREGEGIHNESEVFWRADGTSFLGEYRSYPVYRDHEIIGAVVTLWDITERRRMEEQIHQYTEELENMVAERTEQIRKLETQRMQSEKLAALGQLAAGVAHEINNPLAGVSNGFVLIKDAIPKDHPNFPYVDIVDRGIARVTEIVENMYQLYGSGPREGRLVQVAIIVKDVIQMLTKQIKEREITVVQDIPADLPDFLMLDTELAQVLTNLLQNAIDASPNGGTIHMTVKHVGNTLRIEVADRGGGIAPELSSRIFEPFFTNKTGRQKSSMGLGLSVSNSLVEAMGGSIEVDSRLEEGTTFAVVLPLKAQEDTGE